MSAVSLRQTFRKQERLCSRKILQTVSLDGKNIHASPLRLAWMSVKLPEKVPVQAAFTVPKRIFKDAVTRNRLKRLMREAYRKNKSSLYALISQREMQCALLFIFTGKNIATYPETEEKIKIILQRLEADVKKING